MGEVAWCAVTPRKDVMMGRGRVAHRSALCHRFGGIEPTQVWVEDGLLFVPPMVRGRGSARWEWCSLCAKAPGLESWRARAACRGSGLDWMTMGRDWTAHAAICEACPVRRDCDRFARRVHVQYGVWAGRRLPGRL